MPYCIYNWFITLDNFFHFSGGSGIENIGGNGNNGGGRSCMQWNTEFSGTDLQIVLNGQNNKVGKSIVI